jgi:hypothetical protein
VSTNSELIKHPFSGSESPLGAERQFGTQAVVVPSLRAKGADRGAACRNEAFASSETRVFSLFLVSKLSPIRGLHQPRKQPEVRRSHDLKDVCVSSELLKFQDSVELRHQGLRSKGSKEWKNHNVLAELGCQRNSQLIDHATLITMIWIDAEQCNRTEPKSRVITKPRRKAKMKV